MSVCNFRTYSGFFFLIHFLPVLGNLFSDREQLLLVDFFKHLNMKHCIILGNNISSNINLQMVKQFSALKIYTGIQTEREMLVSDISEKSIAPKSVVVYKSVDNVARIKEYFSYLHKVSSLQEAIYNVTKILKLIAELRIKFSQQSNLAHVC